MYGSVETYFVLHNSNSTMVRTTVKFNKSESRMNVHSENIRHTSKKQCFAKFIHTMDPIDAMLIQRWIDDMDQPRQDYSGYYFVENGRVSGFALLRKCEFDPFQ